MKWELQSIANLDRPQRPHIVECERSTLCVLMLLLHGFTAYPRGQTGGVLPSASFYPTVGLFDAEVCRIAGAPLAEVLDDVVENRMGELVEVLDAIQEGASWGPVIAGALSRVIKAGP